MDAGSEAIAPGNLVLSSHQRLDELLTTGYNLSLMEELGLKAAKGKGEIIGYKGDPDRKMGIVGTVSSLAAQDFTVKDWIELITSRFEGIDGTNLQDLENGSETALIKPKVVACMNAFEPGIVERLLHVIDSPSGNIDHPGDTSLYPSTATLPTEDTPDIQAIEAGSLPIISPSQPLISPSEILYITGEPRPLGVELAKTLNMPVIYIGHNRSEVWAIKHLAKKVKEVFKGLEVVVVDEEEVKVERVKRVKVEGEGGKGDGQAEQKKQKRVRQPNSIKNATSGEAAMAAEVALADPGAGIYEQPRG